MTDANGLVMPDEEHLELARGRAHNVAVVCRAMADGVEGWEPTAEMLEQLASLAETVENDIELVKAWSWTF